MNTVSAIIPTYNSANYIIDALESVFSQTRPVDEIIVVDDGSTDNTFDVIKRYDKRISYIKQKNRGPAAARNKGILKAKGDYIAFLDSDDIWVEDKTMIQMDFFIENPDLDFVFCDMVNFSEIKEDIAPEIRNKEVHDYFVSHATNLENIFECLIKESVIPTPSIIFKRACIKRVGLFNEKLKIGEDLEYWLRASRTCRFGFVNAVLVKRRRHEENLVNNWVGMNKALIKVLEEIGNKGTKIPSKTQKILSNKLYSTQYDLGSYFFKRQNFREAWLHFSRGKARKISDIKYFGKLVLSWFLKRFG